MATPAADPFADFPDAPAEPPVAAPAPAVAASDPFAAFPDAPEAEQPQKAQEAAEPQGPTRGSPEALAQSYLIASHAPGGPNRDEPPDFAAMSTHSPVTARHLSTPKAMLTSAGDYDKLSGVERHLTGSLFSLSRGADDQWTPPKWFAGFAAGTAGLLSSAGKLGEDLGVFRDDQPWSAQYAAERRAAINHFDAVASTEIATSNLGEEVVVGGSRAAPALAAFAAAGAAGGFAAMAALGAGLGFPGLKRQILEVRGPNGEEIDPTIATGLAAGTAVVGGAAQAVALGPLAKSVFGPTVQKFIPGLLNRILTSNAIGSLAGRMVARTATHAALGAAGMAFTGALDDTAIQAAKVKAGAQGEIDLSQAYERGKESYIQGLKDFALLSLWGGARRMFHEAGVRSASLREQEALAGAGQYLEGIKNPEAVAAVVAEVAPGKSAFIERSRWDAYWQEKGIDPQRKAAEVAGEGTNPHDVAGDFIALPLNRYLSAFGGSEHLLSLAPDVKLSPDTRTAREQITFDEAELRLETEAQKTRGADFEIHKRAVADAIKEQAISRGVDADEAAASANTIAEAAGSVALKAGLSVKQATILMGLQRYKVLGVNAEDIAKATSEQLRAQMPAEELHTVDLVHRAGSGDQLAISELGRRAQAFEAEAANAKKEAAQAKAEGLVEPLTGGGNRLAYERDKKALKGGTWVQHDLNHLTQINSRLGHVEGGDAALRESGRVLREIAEQHGGRFYRWGGDELATWFPEGADVKAWEADAARALADLPELVSGKRTHKVSISSGMGTTPEAADRALYRAKDEAAAAGRGGSIDKTNIRLQEIAKELTTNPADRAALEQEQAALVAKKARIEAGLAAPNFEKSHFFAADEAGGPAAKAIEAPAAEPEIARIGGKPVTYIPAVPLSERSVGRVVTPQRPGAGEAIHYRVIEADQLVPSHTPDSFTPHPDYPAGVQERDYRRQPEEQLKVARGAQQLDPSFLLSDTPSALDGPPIVTSGDKAIVLGGNGRSMMLLSGLKDAETAAKYRAELTARAVGFGIDPAQIEGMKNPVLVRELDGMPSDAPKPDLAAAVRRFNENLTQALSPKLLAVSEARTLTPDAVQSIARVLMDGDGSLRDVLTNSPEALIDLLRQEGIITPQNQAGFVKGRIFTEEGKDRVEGMFVGRVIGTAERLAQSPSALIAKLERIAGPLLQVEGINPALGETETVQKAIDLVNDARVRRLSVDIAAGQASLFGEARPDAAVVALAKMLEGRGVREIQSRFRGWAIRAGVDPAQGGLFGATTQTEARAVLLGAEATVEQPRRATSGDISGIFAGLKEAHPGVDFSLGGGAGGVVVLSRIVVKEREQGTGSAFMRDLVAAADAAGLTLAATPSSDFGGTKGRIVEWNKRFGFVENKGRTKDLEISETMYRRPKSPSVSVEQKSAQTSTPEFKAWFGDSKVVDAEGKPIVVVHGSQGFKGDAFSRDSAAKGPSKVGFWFTDDPAFGEIFGSEILPVYLSLKNPKVLTQAKWDALRVQHGGDAEWFGKWRDDLIAQGFDGVIVPGTAEKLGRFDVRSPGVFAAFRSEQIKSATGNRGTFDPSNPSILKQSGADGPRGLVRMRLDATGRPVDFPIQLLAGDASTLAHETGHFFSWAMHDVAMDPRGAPAFRADYDAMLKWAGYGSPEERLAQSLERADLEAREDSLAPAEKGRLADLKAKEEKIGHGWELYFAEGHAPSRELARTFAWFRRSITDVYRGLYGAGDQYRRNYGRELGLSEEIRGVFDRWLAAETEVSRGGSNEPIPPEVLDKLNPADRDALLRARDDRRNETEAGVYQALTQAEKDQHADTRAKVRQQVADELDSTPVWKAIDYLTRDPSPEAGLIDVALGNLDPSLVDQSGRSWNLDLAEVKEAVGDDGMKSLPRGITAKKGGMPLDFVAERLGFQTGQEMIDALKVAGKRETAIEARTQAKMEELFPGMLKDPEAVTKAAVEAEHTPEAAIEALVGARILARTVDPTLGMRLRVMEDRATRKASAERLVAGIPVSALSPALYLRAERAAGKRALELTGQALGRDTAKRKEHAAAAMDARDVQLLNMELWRAATDAKAQAEKDAATLAEYQRPGKVRAEVGKAHETLPDGTVAQPYLERIDALLGAVEFGNASRSGVAARASTLADIQAWIVNRWLDGDSITFPPKLMERLQRVTHWKDLTPTELTSFRQAVESIAAQAEQRTTFEVGKTKEETTRVIGELAAAALENGAHVRLSLVPANKTLKEAVAEGTRQAIHALTRPEVLFDALDGYQPDGPWKRYVWDPISDASYRFHDLVRTASEPVRKILRDLPLAERSRIRNTRFEVDGETYTLENAIVVGLQMGNESNDSKLVRGMSSPSLVEDFNVKPWQGRATRDAILAQLTASDVKIINSIHKALESYWEAASALETKDTGVAPKKVATKAFRFKGKGGVDLVIDGGYYPIIYSRMFRIGQVQAEADAAAANGLPGLYDPAYERVMTPNGHLQERVESYARPFDLTLDALPRKLTMTAKDIAFRMAAKQTYRVLVDRKIVGALQQALGYEGHALVLGHLRDAVNDVMIPDQGAGWALRVMNKARSLTYQNVFSLNVAQTLQNLADPVGIGAVMPARFFAAASLDIGRRRGVAVQEILAESPEMRIRADGLAKSLNRDIEDTFRKSVPGLAWDRLSELMLLPFETTQKATEFPTYAGAKAHAQAPKDKGGLGMEQAEAVQHAEAAVRKMFGGHRTVDLTPIQRHKILRWGTMFWGWAGAQLNQFISASGKAGMEWSDGRKAKAMKTVGAAFAYLYAKQIASEILVGRGPADEDDDGLDAKDVGSWAAFRGVMTLPGFVPVVSQMARGVSGETAQRDVQLTPWLNLLNGPVKAGRTTAAYIAHVSEDSEGDDEGVQLFLAWLEAGGQFVGGAPVGQVRKTARYWNGRQPDAAIGEDVLGTAYGPAKKGSLSSTIYGR